MSYYSYVSGEYIENNCSINQKNWMHRKLKKCMYGVAFYCIATMTKLVPRAAQARLFLVFSCLCIVFVLTSNYFIPWIQGGDLDPLTLEAPKLDTTARIYAIYNSSYFTRSRDSNQPDFGIKLTHPFIRLNTSEKLKIAILIPTTSRSIGKEQFFQNSSLTQISLPALHRTMDTSRYIYSIYIGIDKGDYLETIQDQLRNISKYIIPIIVNSVNFRECVNAIAKKAFDDGNDYFVRINDDSHISTYNWTTLGIQTLLSYKPPNVGVVGPTSPEIDVPFMTHDMVHRSHLEIFKYYYPPEFSDWYSDTWMTYIYSPIRSTQLPDWTVNHKRIHGTRYKIIKKQMYRLKLIDTIDKSKIMAYIYPKRQVVSFTLYGEKDKYIEGALANAELMRTIYPGWVMRIYHDSTVPIDILVKLAGYEYVHLIEMSKFANQKRMWRFLVASDQTVNVYVIRDIDARLSAREKSAVDKWLETDKQFHVMRDHPNHLNRVMLSGLWGGRRDAISNMGQRMAEINFEVKISKNGHDEIVLFLEFVVWPVVRQSVVQHDSFSCKAYGPSFQFPTARKGMEFVGSKYEHGKVDEKMIEALRKAEEC